MRRLMLSTASLLLAMPVWAQESARLPGEAGGDPALVIRMVLDRAPDTPEGRGYMDVARTEALIAAVELDEALQRPDDLAWIKRHVGRAVHAIDPTEVSPGAGLGFGVKQATQKMVDLVTAAAQQNPDDQNLVLLATPVVTAGQTALKRADRAVRLGRMAASADTPSQARGIVDEMSRVVMRMYEGHDADGDGEATWNLGEGGLEQAFQHMKMMEAGEGLAAR